MNNSEINVGIDTSKDQLDIGIRPTGKFFSVSNNSDGIKAAVRTLLKHKSDRDLIEATGRLEIPFACAAYKAGLPIVICNARAVHDFAKSTGQLAKTDKLDAFATARFGEAVKPKLTILKPDKLQLISDLVTTRAQCLTLSTHQKNRLSRMPKSTHAPIKRILNSTQKEIIWIGKNSTN